MMKQMCVLFDYPVGSALCSCYLSIVFLVVIVMTLSTKRPFLTSFSELCGYKKYGIP